MNGTGAMPQSSILPKGSPHCSGKVVNAKETPVSLFVVHWNQPAECVASLNALGAQQVPLQVTLIDNDSKPEAFQTLKSLIGPDVRFVRLKKNEGWGGALNVVLQRWLEEDQNPYCVISAHDAIAEPNCLRLLIDSMRSDSQIGIACPQYRDQSIGRFSSLRGVFPEHASARPAGAVQPVDVPHGTLMLVRRECLQKTGLFDERYFAYGDEHELGLRARRNGWKVVMVWGAVVTNRGTWTESPLRSYLFARNSLLLVHDYGGKLSAFLRASLILLNTVRLMVRTPNQSFAFSARARFLAVRDYFLGRWGRPNLAG
jgi:N-acetylglucosaminyl-diphospho-decaprenol L-rhamnosyltransferase